MPVTVGPGQIDLSVSMATTTQTSGWSISYQLLKTKSKPSSRNETGRAQRGEAAKDTHRSNVTPTIRLAGIKIADDLDLLRCEPFDHTRPRHLASRVQVLATGGSNEPGRRCALELRRGTARTFDTRTGREHGGRLCATRPGTWTQGHNDASVCRPYRRENTLLVGCASVRGRQVGMPRETRQLPPFYQHVSLRT
ncbi:hypothetical protein K0M31_007715 [Melipona bicolor]|uniref:Uncharacterized protein n=1 Tax=Melipona bicolor TaxID=60889 RepID=A0AA40GBX7_9HYME|nr:hypothetical protein K0M31_007715 [Melipona bicolor]